MGLKGAILGGIIAGPFGAVLGYALGEIFEDTPTVHIEAKKIAILGMKESGKTQFLKTLQQVPYTQYVQTGINDYDSFQLDLPSGKIVEIQSGQDIGGAESFVLNYKKIAEGVDAVFFVFDVYKFFYDKEYRTLTRARLQFIDEGLGIPANKRAVIGSHADQFADDSKKVEGQQFAIENLKDVYKPIYNNFFMRDMRDYNQAIEICNKLLS